MSATDTTGTVPSWPQLAGWLATPSHRTATGRWRSTSGGTAESGTFGYRAPGDWRRTWDSGSPPDQRSPDTPLHWAGPDPLADGSDRWWSIEPVAAVRHDGRLAWRARIITARQQMVVLLVDDETGMCLSASDGAGTWAEDVIDLVVDPALPDGLLDQAVQARQQEDAMHWLHDLLRRRPVPTPHWFPWRRSSVGPAGWRSVAARRGGLITRVRAGQPVPPLPWSADETQTLGGRDGWTYVLSGVDRTAAAAVVDQIVDGRPYDW